MCGGICSGVRALLPKAPKHGSVAAGAAVLRRRNWAARLLLRTHRVPFDEDADPGGVVVFPIRAGRQLKTTVCATGPRLLTEGAGTDGDPLGSLVFYSTPLTPARSAA